MLHFNVKGLLYYNKIITSIEYTNTIGIFLPEKSFNESTQGKYTQSRRICQLSNDAKCSRISYM